MPSPAKLSDHENGTLVGGPFADSFWLRGIILDLSGTSPEPHLEPPVVAPFLGQRLEGAFGCPSEAPTGIIEYASWTGLDDGSEASKLQSPCPDVDYFGCKI